MTIDRHAGGKAGYHPFTDEDGKEYGSFEVFFAEAYEAENIGPSGWYWHACFPGCLPDGEPDGPYSTSEQAFNAARGE